MKSIWRRILGMFHREPHHHDHDSERLDREILEVEKQELEVLREIERDVHPHRYTVTVTQTASHHHHPHSTSADAERSF